MLESRSLRYFLAVAEQLHFGRAADTLGIAQSALSRQIKEFEQSLGVRLLNRGRRSAISLTDAGQAFYVDALVGTRQLERAEKAAHRAARGEVGRLSVGYVASAALTGVMPAALGRFRGKYPDVDVQLASMETPTQLAAFGDGRIDVGFLRPRHEYPDGVTAVVLHGESLLLALAADHPLAGKRIDLERLAEETFIIPQFDESAGFAEHLTRLAARGGFEPRKIVRVRDFLTAIALAAAGYGVVPVPKCVASIVMHNVRFKAIQGFEGTAQLAIAYGNRASATVLALVKEALRNRTTKQW